MGESQAEVGGRVDISAPRGGVAHVHSRVIQGRTGPGHSLVPLVEHGL